METFDEEYTVRSMILHWSKRLLEAVQEQDMSTAFDISSNTLPKCWTQYKECTGNVPEHLRTIR